MFDHYPDMNHDGSKDSRDAGLFQSLMDTKGDDSGKPSAGPSAPLPKNKEEWIAYNALKGLFIGVPALYIVLLLGGIVPMTGVTALLALFALAGILGILTM